MQEMQRRGYSPNSLWLNPFYRGTKEAPYTSLLIVPTTTPIYSEHNAAYYQECIDNLAMKGINIP